MAVFFRFFSIENLKILETRYIYLRHAFKRILFKYDIIINMSIFYFTELVNWQLKKVKNKCKSGSAVRQHLYVGL